MLIRVTDARLVRDFVVWLRFDDRTEGEVDLPQELIWPIFEPLKGSDVSRQF